MPITSSAKKALRQNHRRRAKNVLQKKALKIAIKAVEKQATPQGLSRAYQLLDKAAKLHVIPKNTAARQKARLSRLLAKPATNH